MPIDPDGAKKSYTIVLRKQQIETLREMAAAQSTPNHEVRLSDVVREVIDRGLEHFYLPTDSRIATANNAKEAVGV